MALAGMVSLSLQGASMLRKHDGSGYVVLALVVGGLVLAFVYGFTESRRGRAERAAAIKPPLVRTVTVDTAAEFPHPSSAVWALIRPAESALTLTGGVYHAASVPAVDGGPGELQCFFSRNGHIGVIEVVEEIPEQLAVTRHLLPAGGAAVLTTYRLEAMAEGAKLIVESEFELPENVAMDQDMWRRYWTHYFDKVRALLDQQASAEAAV